MSARHRHVAAMRCAAPRLKGAVGTARVRPDSRPPPDHAAAADRLATRIADRRCPNVAVRAHHHRCPVASAPVAAKPRIPAPSSTPRRLRRCLPRQDAAVADSAR
jgi:hypothetical protein